MEASGTDVVDLHHIKHYLKSAVRSYNFWDAHLNFSVTERRNTRSIHPDLKLIIRFIHLMLAATAQMSVAPS